MMQRWKRSEGLVDKSEREREGGRGGKRGGGRGGRGGKREGVGIY